MNKDTLMLVMVLIRGMNFTKSKIGKGPASNLTNSPLISGLEYTVNMLEKWRKGGNPLG